MEKGIVKECQKCAVLEKELDNIKKDVDEMRIDMKVFQKINQEVEIKLGKLETFITQKFLQITDKLDEINNKMDSDTENKHQKKMAFISQFLYPGLYGLILVYITWELNRR